MCDIVCRFDIIAIEEVTGDLRMLRDMKRYPGDDWGFLMTDVTPEWFSETSEGTPPGGCRS